MKRALVFRPERGPMRLSCVLACELKAFGVEDPRDLITRQKPPRRLSMVLVDGTPWPDPAAGTARRHPRRVLHQRKHHPERRVLGGSPSRGHLRGMRIVSAVCPFNALSRDEKKECMVKCNLSSGGRHTAMRSRVPDRRPFLERRRSLRAGEEKGFCQGDDGGPEKWLIRK